MGEFFEFWRLEEAQNVWVLLGAVFLGATSGAIGSFNFLKKRSLVGDALSHSALPGVTTAFLIFKSNNLLVISLGAFVSCYLANWLLKNLSVFTKIKPDSALAIILSVFFALGLFQLTLIQKMPEASQAGLASLLFGKAQAISHGDLKWILGLSLVCAVFLVIYFRQLKTLTFDRVFARTSGISINRLENIFGFFLVLSIVIGVQMAGVVLMAALLLTPAAAARYLAKDLRSLVLLSSAIGGVSAALGVSISYTSPGMPTGPWIVVVASLIFLLCAVFSPGRGILPRYLRRLENRRRMRDEDIVRSLFKLGDEVKKDPPWLRSKEILGYRNFSFSELRRSLQRLESRGLVEELERGGTEDLYRLTPQGISSAVQLTRYHRLWEAYLSQNINLPSDHLHEDAEDMEHLIDAEIEAQILDELGGLLEDPHGKPIPEAD